MLIVTGAAGFIASNLARKLAERGERDLLLVDHPLTAAGAANFAGLPSFRFLEHTALLEALEGGKLQGVRGIFHLGACSDTTERNWTYLASNNVEYTRRLWDWCASQAVPYIYASSAATYGDGSRGFDDEVPPESLEPLNLYGKSKNDFDIWALRHVEAGGAAPKGWAGLKFFNVYGPQESHKGRMASMVWHSYHQIAAKGEVGLFKSTEPDMPDGGQRRDFVYVGDCVDHMIWLWEHPDVCGIFNSGTGQARSFRELAEATFHALGREPKIRYIEMPQDLRGAYQSFTQATMKKLGEAGYPGRPTSLEEGVGHYVAWLKTHYPPK
ncbi:ADP-glyceromanno-heptose 6-epimerase [Singulisphaera sp. PoT]|uniref:ADP-glyceromanno-heptose 6-epimerase n=1 Tax=Singulisphaera sp. PoT TaxID=3411797 RepID=UPI003BF563BF